VRAATDPLAARQTEHRLELARRLLTA
jgi:hypothetical protein